MTTLSKVEANSSRPDGYTVGSVLFVAAVAEELGNLPGVTIGIGPVEAAIGMSLHLGVHRPGAVVLVGSAGSYVDEIEIGTAIVCGRSLWRCPGAVAKVAYAVGPERVEHPDRGLVERVGLREVTVCTTPAITSDPAVVAALAEEAQVEHLETHAVARACAAAGVPFVAVLGIANRVGPDAHAEWLANRAVAEAAAREAARAAFG